MTTEKLSVINEIASYVRNDKVTRIDVLGYVFLYGNIELLNWAADGEDSTAKVKLFRFWKSNRLDDLDAFLDYVAKVATEAKNEF